MSLERPKTEDHEAGRRIAVARLGNVAGAAGGPRTCLSARTRW
jgi:hypothetical protein